MTPSRNLIAYYVDRNIQQARTIAADLWQRGFTALAPHLATAHFDGLCDDHDFLAGTLELMRRCDLLVIPFNWAASAGTIEEIREAFELEIPVFEWPHLDRQLTADHFNFRENSDGPAAVAAVEPEPPPRSWHATALTPRTKSG